MESGGVACAMTGAGEFTAPPLTGLKIVTGNPQTAAGGGSAAGGITEVFDGGVGIVLQLATFAGKPWHCISAHSDTSSNTDPATRETRWLARVVCISVLT